MKDSEKGRGGVKKRKEKQNSERGDSPQWCSNALLELLGKHLSSCWPQIYARFCALLDDTQIYLQYKPLMNFNYPVQWKHPKNETTFKSEETVSQIPHVKNEDSAAHQEKRSHHRSNRLAWQEDSDKSWQEKLTNCRGTCQWLSGREQPRDPHCAWIQAHYLRTLSYVTMWLSATALGLALVTDR